MWLSVKIVIYYYQLGLITITYSQGMVDRNYYLVSKVRSYMNCWVKCISVAIAKTASRNVAFKAGRMRDSIMEVQYEFIISLCVRRIAQTQVWEKTMRTLQRMQVAIQSCISSIKGTLTCFVKCIRGLQIDAYYRINAAPQSLIGSKCVDVKGETSRLTLSIFF